MRDGSGSLATKREAASGEPLMSPTAECCNCEICIRTCENDNGPMASLEPAGAEPDFEPPRPEGRWMIDHLKTGSERSDNLGPMRPELRIWSIAGTGKPHAIANPDTLLRRERPHF